jgi:ribulose kinase
VQRSFIEEATALGAAILASVGGGIHKDVVVATEKMVSIGEEYRPTKAHKNLYDELFRIHTDAYSALEKAKVFARLKALDQ